MYMVFTVIVIHNDCVTLGLVMLHADDWGERLTGQDYT